MIDCDNPYPSWGFEIKWTKRDGVISIASTKGHPNEESARLQALENAKNFGWTPPKWWEYWRWNDTDFGSRLGSYQRLFQRVIGLCGGGILGGCFFLLWFGYSSILLAYVIACIVVLFATTWVRINI